MDLKREFLLEKAASRSGGDKYKELPGKEREALGSVYLQQFYSRPKGKPLETISITLHLPD